MNHLSEFQFGKLTPDPRKYYRVSWFGEVSYFDGHKPRPSPVISVFLEELITTPPFESVMPSDFKNGGHKKLIVPVALLGVIHIGDIWYQNRLFQKAEHHHFVENFNRLNINADTSMRIPARARFGVNDWLPLDQHPFHYHFTRGWCEKIFLGDSTYLIIPHIAIIQMFLAPDTFVLEQAFKNGLTLETLCDSEKSWVDEKSGDAFVHLRKHVLDASHKVCALIMFDKHFREAYLSISKSLSFQRARNFGELSPMTTMPVRGEQAMTVTGQWIAYPDGRKSFLAFQILASDLKLPFRSVRYFRDNPGDRNPNANPPGSKKTRGGSRKKPKRKRKPLPVDPDSDPNGEFEPVTGKLSSIFKFPNLALTPSKKERQEDHKNDEVNPKRPVNDDAQGAGAGGKGKDDVPLWQGVDDPDEPLKETKQPTYSKKFSRVSLFNAVLSELESPSAPDLESLWIDNVNIFQFPTVKLKSKQTSTWDNLNYRKGAAESSSLNHQPRCVLVAQVRIKSGARFTLLESERKMRLALNGWYESDKLSLLAVDSGALTTRKLDQLLKETVKNSGWPTDLVGLNGFPIRHTGKDLLDSGVNDYAVKMAKNIMDSLKARRYL